MDIVDCKRIRRGAWFSATRVSFYPIDVLARIRRSVDHATSVSLPATADVYVVDDPNRR